MNKNEFFREATLRICGNLKIEEALQTLIQFLTASMPVTKIYLQHYDQDFQAMRTIAFADEKECKKLDLLTPLSKTARDMAGNAPTETDAFLLDDPSTFPVSREMTEFHGLPSTSVILLVLRAAGDTLGYLVLISEGEQ